MSEKDSKEDILKAFKLFDDDETVSAAAYYMLLFTPIVLRPNSTLLLLPFTSVKGKISFRNLKRVANELGENMSDDELQEMIDEADMDGGECTCVF